MFRRSGAIIVLLGLYLLAGQIGNSFSQGLMIFSIFMWVIAAGLFVYLMLFRGMKIDLFRKKVANDNSDIDEAAEADAVSEAGEDEDSSEGSVVRRLPVSD